MDLLDLHMLVLRIYMAQLMFDAKMPWSNKCLCMIHILHNHEFLLVKWYVMFFLAIILTHA